MEKLLTAIGEIIITELDGVQDVTYVGDVMQIKLDNGKCYQLSLCEKSEK